MARSSSLRHEPAFFVPSADVASYAKGLPSRERPVDLIHLSHQTMGDVGLEREILGLLGRQIASFTGRLASAAASERLRVAHAMRGAALNVGAFPLARSAEALEIEPGSDAALTGFEAEMSIAAGFIADLLRG